MFAYIVRRLLWSVVLLIVLSIVTFSIFYLIPRTGWGDPGDAGSTLCRASRYRRKRST